MLVSFLVLVCSINCRVWGQEIFYPLKKTIWYFNTYYEKSDSNPDQNDLKVILGKQKTNYKIEFTDDEHFVVSYTDKTGLSYINSGKYSLDNSLISFIYDKKQEIRKDKNGKVIQGYPEPQQLTPAFYDPKDFHSSKGTRRYFQFLFSMDYEAVYYKKGTLLELNAKVISEFPGNRNMPTLPVGGH